MEQPAAGRHPRRADRPRTRTADEPRTFTALLAGLVRARPEAIAAVDADPHGPVPVRRIDLWRRVSALRVDLARAGVGRHSPVAVWLPNWSDALCWQFAAASLGGHVVGVNTRYNVAEVAHVLDRARPVVVAVAHGFHELDLADRLRRAVDQSAAGPPSVAVVAGPRGTATVADLPGYDVGAGAWLPAADTALPPPTEHRPVPPAPDGSDLAVAFTTSGSTGAPKLAAHREAAVVEHALADAAGIGFRDRDVMVCALPLAGTFGFSTALAALAGGAVCLLEPVFDADAVLADMARWRATHLVGGDDMIGRLAAAWREGPVGAGDGSEPPDLRSWRWLGIADFTGHARELAAWAYREFGTLVTGVYGSSEVFALAAFWPADDPVPHRWRAGGRPVTPRTEARITDPASGRPLAVGSVGELQWRGPGVVDAYLGDTDAVDRAVTADGWFRTGDLAEIAADGGIGYICRIGDTLRLRGFLVAPEEIERRLAQHDAVRAAKVVGVRGPDGGDEAVGFVVPAPGHGVDGQSLRSWCADALAAFKVPVAVYVIDEMPVTTGTNGTKIRTAVLRERARQHRDQERNCDGEQDRDGARDQDGDLGGGPPG